MSEEWFYAEQDKQQGPVSLEQLQEMAGAGGLGRGQLVWREGLVEWVGAETIPALAEAMPHVAATPIAAAVPLGHQESPQIQYFNPTGAVVAYAGFWWRFLAYIIDIAILWVPKYILQAALNFSVRMPMPTGRRAPMFFGTLMTAGGLVTIALEWLYFALMESSSRQATLGKMICGLIVTDQSGAPIGFGRATGRYFGKIISGIILYIGFIMAGFTQRKQALHDMMARTLVIKKNLPQG